MNIVSVIDKHGYAWVQTAPNKQRYMKVDAAPATKRSGSAWSKPWKSLAQGCTIEQMSEYNETAQPGAEYVPSKRYPGLCELHCDSRRAQLQEIGFRGNVDFDSYGDAPRPSEFRRRRAAKNEVTPTWQEIRNHFAPQEEYATHSTACWKWHPACVARILIEEIEQLHTFLDGLREVDPEWRREE